MRIGVNANFFQKPSTGIGVVTSEFMRALALTAEGRSHEWTWYYEGDVPAGEWPVNWRFKRVTTWWSRDDVPHRYLWERFAVPRAVIRDHCDVFFSLYQSATRLPDTIQHVMLVHDLIPRHFPEYLGNWRQRFYYHSIESAIQAADRIITPSGVTATDVQSLLAVPSARLSVVPLGIAKAFQTPLSSVDRDAVLKRYGLESGYLYHGGGLELRKNTAMLLRAYAKAVHASESVGLPLLVISGRVYAESNPLATPVRTLVRELGLEDHVRLLGWVPEADLPALYQGALAFVYPSLYEGFGLPVLEAFASGTPVISTIAGSLACLVDDAALIINPDDDDTLVKALLSIVTDAHLRDQLIARGRMRAAGYDWSRFTQAAVSHLLQY